MTTQRFDHSSAKRGLHSAWDRRTDTGRNSAARHSGLTDQSARRSQAGAGLKTAHASRAARAVPLSRQARSSAPCCRRSARRAAPTRSSIDTQQIVERRAVRILEVATRLDRSTAAAGQHDRQMIVRVRIAVAQTAAVQHHAVIKQRPLPLANGAELCHEIGVLRDKIAVDDPQLGDQLFACCGDGRASGARLWLRPSSRDDCSPRWRTCRSQPA